MELAAGREWELGSEEALGHRNWFGATGHLRKRKVSTKSIASFAELTEMYCSAANNSVRKHAIGIGYIDTNLIET